MIDVRDQESARNNHEKNRNTTFGTLQSTAAPHEGVYRTAMPSEGVEHTMGDSPSLLPSPIERGQYVRTAGRSRRSRGQAVLVNPESNYGVYQARNRSVGAHRIPINHDRGPKDPVQVYGTPALPRNRASRLGGGPHQGQTTHGRDAPALHMLCTDDNRLVSWGFPSRTTSFDVYSELPNHGRPSNEGPERGNIRYIQAR